FHNVNGWAWQDTAILISTTTLSFGIVFVFAKGASELAVTVRQGELDYYLAFPADVLWHLSVSKTRIDAMGDLVYGLTLFFMFAPLTFTTITAFLVGSFLAGVVMYSFIVATGSLAFFFANIEEAS